MQLRRQILIRIGCARADADHRHVELLAPRERQGIREVAGDADLEPEAAQCQGGRVAILGPVEQEYLLAFE